MGKKRDRDRDRRSSKNRSSSTSSTRQSRSSSATRTSSTTSDTAHRGTSFSRPTAENTTAQRTPKHEQTTSQRQKNIQRALKGTDTSQDEVPDQVLDVIGGGGMPLNNSIQRSLEDRMDADFSDVRIHTGGKAAQAADAIDAKAFTCGNDIVFNAGEYDPNSAEGQHLLAHELAHVKQQNGGAPLSMKPKANADLEIDPDPQLEREADKAAQEALSDGPVTINRMGTDIHIQRAADDESGFMSPSRIRQFISEEMDKKLDQRVPEEVDKHLQQRSEEIEEMVSGSDQLDEEALSDMGVDMDALDGGESSWFDRLQEGATDPRTAVAGGVGATFAALTTIASAGSLPLAAGVAVASSGAFASKMLENGTANAALGEDNLSQEELATIVETVKRELNESDDTGDYPGDDQ